MEYSIGQVSRLLGLSIEGIRNYEKSGIIQSHRPEDSNYRKYNYLDITSLIRARLYRALGYSLRETEALTNDSDIGDVRAMLNRRRAALTQEIALAELTLRRLEALERSLETLEGELGRVAFCDSPAICRIEFSRNCVIDFSAPAVAAFQRWMDWSPFIYVSSRYCRGDVYGGLAMDAEYAEPLGVEVDGRVARIPSRPSLRLTVAESENGFSDVGILQKLYDFADRHRLCLAEDMIGHTVIGVNKARDYRRYRRIYVEILEEI